MSRIGCIPSCIKRPDSFDTTLIDFPTIGQVNFCLVFTDKNQEEEYRTFKIINSSVGKLVRSQHYSLLYMLPIG